MDYKSRMTHPVKLLLQFFICIIYAELLKAVPLKGLKSAQKERDLSVYCDDTHGHTDHTPPIIMELKLIHSPIDVQHSYKALGLSLLSAQG